MRSQERENPIGTASEASQVQEILMAPHHPFIDRMAESMPQRQFLKFLTISKTRFEGLGKDFLNPDGDPPLFDEEMLLQEERILDSTTPENKSQERATYDFAIWAYGTNPNIKKRIRKVENKPSVGHAFNVIEILSDSGIDDTKSRQAAALHDVPEDTPYTHEDMEELFGEDISNIVRHDTKMDTKKLLEGDWGEVEIDVMREFLHPFIGNPDVEELFRFTDRLYASEKTVSELDMRLVRNRQDIYHYSELPKKASEILTKYAQDQEQIDQLTLMRILGSAKHDQARYSAALPIKCADVVDNTSTFPQMAQSLGKKSVQPKADLARTIYAPLADLLGLPNMSRAIRGNIYKFERPQRTKKLEEALALAQADRESRITDFMNIGGDIQNNFMSWSSALGTPFTMEADQHLPTVYDVIEKRIPESSYSLPILELMTTNPYAKEALIDFLKEPGLFHPDIWYLSDKQTPLSEVHEVSYTKLIDTKRRKFYTEVSAVSGQISDLWKTRSSYEQKTAAYTKLRTLSGASGIPVLIESLLGNGMREVSLKGGSSDRYRDTSYVALLPKQATYFDEQLILRPREADPSYDWYDRIKTKVGRTILTTALMSLEKKKENQSTLDISATNRGVKIFSTLWDAWVILNKGTDRQVAVARNSQNYLEEILKAATIINPDLFAQEFFSNIGKVPQDFGRNREDLTLKTYHRWTRFIPNFEKNMTEVTSWTDKNYVSKPMNRQVIENPYEFNGYASYPYLYQIGRRESPEDEFDYTLETDFADAFRLPKDSVTVKELKIVKKRLYLPDQEELGMFVNWGDYDVAAQTLHNGHKMPEQYDPTRWMDTIFGYGVRRGLFL